jgi:putative ABC transport system substrate-binding protein
MRRRHFLTVLGGGAALWPFAGLAQPASTLRTIGFLVPGSRLSHGHRAMAFAHRLGELGWHEGRNVTIEYRWAEGRRERYSEIAAEFVRLNVTAIVTAGTEPVAAAKQVASVIPIVFATAGDPIGTGLVASLARPGGNITGLSMQQTDAAGKRLGLLREMVPDLRRLAIMANTASPLGALETREIQAAAHRLGIESVVSNVRQSADVGKAMEGIKGRVDALYVVIDPVLTTNRVRIVTLAIASRLPIMALSREYVESGGLISYGPNIPEMYRRAADLVDKILRGTKPADIPIEQPTKFELVINLSTARAVGLSIPPSLLARADEVIE